jgi:hypothetical protein
VFVDELERDEGVQPPTRAPAVGDCDHGSRQSFGDTRTDSAPPPASQAPLPRRRPWVIDLESERAGESPAIVLACAIGGERDRAFATRRAVTRECTRAPAGTRAPGEEVPAQTCCAVAR